MKTKFLVEFKFIVKNYKLDSLTKASPCIEICFNELVYRVSNQPTSIRTTIFSTKTHTLEGYYNEKDVELAVLNVYLDHPQLDGDGSIVYQRASEKIINFCTNLKVGTQPIFLLNKLNEIVAECDFVVIKVSKDGQEMINTQDSSKRLEMLSEPITKQRGYDIEMYRFLQDKFKYHFEGTKTFTLFNDYFSFYGKCPFYGFASFEVRESDPRYWQVLFDDVLLLKYGSECREKKKMTPVEYWGSMPHREKLTLLTDMICLVSTSAYYLSDFIQPVRSEIGNGRKKKPGMKYTEDFCPIHGTWSGDCEDLAQFILYMLKSFKLCTGFDKEKYPILNWYQYILLFYIGFFALCGVDRASTETVSSKPQLNAHMCILLIRTSIIRENKKVFFGEDMDLDFYRQFKEHYTPEPEEFSIKDGHLELPNVLVCEGTGYLKSVFSTPFHENIKNTVSLQESVKERIYMDKSSIPFYLYVLEILTNDIIDFGLMNVQSFVLTYDKNINNKVIEGSDNDSFIYGVKIADLLHNPKDIVLVATPPITKSHMDASKKLAKLQAPYPYCSLMDDPSKYERWNLPVTGMYKVDEMNPIVGEQEWKELCEQYKNKVVSLEDLRTYGDYNYVLCPPRSLKETILSLEDASYITQVQFLRLLSDVCVVVVWFFYAKTEVNKHFI